MSMAADDFKPPTCEVSVPLFNYHPIDLLFERFVVPFEAVAAADPLKARGENSFTWQCAFQRRHHASAKTITVRVVQGPTTSNYLGDSPPFDCLVDLSTKPFVHVQDVAFSLAALVFASRYDARTELKDWRSTVSLDDAISSLRKKGTRTSERIIMSATQAFLAILDAAVEKGDSTFNVLCVCDVGKERSLLFLAAAMTMTEILRQHGPRAEALSDVCLARIKDAFGEFTFSPTLPLKRLARHATSTFESLLERFPYFYIHRGILAQGNKRALEVAVASSTSPLLLSMTNYCARCDSDQRDTSDLFFQCQTTYRVFCSAFCVTRGSPTQASISSTYKKD